MWRILIVDDEPYIAQILQAGLESLPDCHVVLTTSSLDALCLFETETFDLLITDYCMPEMTGLQLASQVRAQFPTTSVIMITAFKEELAENEILRRTVDHLLEKPVALGAVRALATELLTHKAH